MNIPKSPNSQEPLSEQLTRDYQIIRMLGSGGMGDVYLAEQRRVGHRRVALKVLKRACSNHPELVRRFENEASSAGRINHRNVVTVYESRVTEDGTLYVAMEFVEGKSLGQILTTQGHLPLNRIVEITKQVGAGLTAAHKLGIVHRDIKPDNIMLTEEDGEQVIKVLDFGIARLSETNSRGKTQSGVIMGTPTYMSPEQAMGKTGNQIDARSDIYSLGLVVYQMLTGKTPFEAKVVMEVMRKHISEPPLPPSEQRRDLLIPAAVDAVILKALEKSREMRQQTVAEFVAELETAATAPTIAPSNQVVQPVQEVAQEAEAKETKILKEGKDPKEKDIPTVRVGPDSLGSTNAPLSSSNLTAARLPRVTREQKGVFIPIPSAPPTIMEPPPTVVPVANRPQSAIGEAAVVAEKTGRRYRPTLLVGLLIFLLLLAGLYAVMQLTGSDVTPHRVMDFRLRREFPTADLDTFNETNAVKPTDSLGFEIKLIEPGWVFLFGTSGDEASGSWFWVNPSTDEQAQRLSVGEWHKFPYGWYLNEINRTAAKKYLLVYVPLGVTWAPAAKLRELGDQVKNGVVDLPADIVTSLLQSLNRDTLPLTASSSKENRHISFALSTTGAARRIAVYEVRLQQTP